MHDDRLLTWRNEAVNCPHLCLPSSSGPKPRGALRAGGDPAQERSAAAGDPEAEGGAERSYY